MQSSLTAKADMRFGEKGDSFIAFCIRILERKGKIVIFTPVLKSETRFSKILEKIFS